LRTRAGGRGIHRRLGPGGRSKTLDYEYVLVADSTAPNVVVLVRRQADHQVASRWPRSARSFCDEAVDLLSCEWLVMNTDTYRRRTAFADMQIEKKHRTVGYRRHDLSTRPSLAGALATRHSSASSFQSHPFSRSPRISVPLTPRTIFYHGSHRRPSAGCRVLSILRQRQIGRVLAFAECVDPRRAQDQGQRCSEQVPCKPMVQCANKTGVRCRRRIGLCYSQTSRRGLNRWGQLVSPFPLLLC
jgi:hypothetical protein